MRSILSVLAAVSAAVAFPILASAQVPASSAPGPAAGQGVEAKHCADPWRPQPGSPGYWEWQANHNLDCIVAMVDEHIGAKGASGVSEDETVTLRRDDLEELRRMAIAAVDAAQRIRR
jgi:hypothetical protein